jgi:hypothetical protein
MEQVVPTAGQGRPTPRRHRSVGGQGVCPYASRRSRRERGPVTDPLMFPNSLVDAAAYDASVREWATMWALTDEFLRSAGRWTSPWVDESWRDGNPIFSAWSPLLRRGLRIIQHDDGTRFVVWRDTFGRGSSKAVDELVISCALTMESLERARDLVLQWLTVGGVMNAGPRPGPFNVEAFYDGIRAA